jgi:hypothetical protein
MAEHAVTEHKVNISIKEKKFKYNKECLCVQRGDTIIWKLTPKFPYGIVIKALVSPLDWSHKITGKGEVIIAKVSRQAAPGLYPYAVGAFDGTELLFDDPDIIVRPPGRG